MSTFFSLTFMVLESTKGRPFVCCNVSYLVACWTDSDKHFFTGGLCLNMSNHVYVSNDVEVALT
jgi:hypothetical protein